ncbi:hypothetical protein HDU96_008202 [Phlyctochytrium bullatum]|nr:hypothetical protein HDU96_008202 [Phlyctochytrium bullatum]
MSPQETSHSANAADKTLFKTKAATMLQGDTSTATQPDFKTLPIVNVSALLDANASEDAKLAAGRAVDEAFRNAGFMYVTGHAVDAGLKKKVLALGREFFLQSQEAKDAIAMKKQEVPIIADSQIDLLQSLNDSQQVRGYQRVGDNITGGHSDWHEAIDLYREVPATDRLRDKPDPMHSSNQWPENPSVFKETYEEYVKQMKRLGAAVMQGIARARGLEPTYFEKFYSESYWCMRSIYYPPLDATLAERKPGDFGCGEHTDYGCLTFVNCEDVKGALEVRNRAGAWIKADPLAEDSFIVNVGDMLSYWSNGLYRSTPHRVQSVAGTDRVSVPFFFEPNYDAVITPIKEFVGPAVTESQATPAEKKVVFGHHLAKRVLSNFKYSPNLETDNASRGIEAK